MTTLVARAAVATQRRPHLVLGGFVVCAIVAAVGIPLAVATHSAHTLHATVSTSTGLQHVAVKAQPTGAADTLALASFVVSAVAALAAVASVVVAVVALPRRGRVRYS